MPTLSMWSFFSGPCCFIATIKILQGRPHSFIDSEVDPVTLFGSGTEILAVFLHISLSTLQERYDEIVIETKALSTSSSNDQPLILKSTFQQEGVQSMSSR